MLLRATYAPRAAYCPSLA